MALLFGIVWGTAAAAPQTSQDKTLPAFVVYDATGVGVLSTQLFPLPGVLVYVRPDCRPCVQMLRDLARAADTGVANRLVIIVEASAPAAGAFLSRSLPEELRGAAWYADENGDAWAAQQLSGLPVTMGVLGQNVEWTLSGAPSRSLLAAVLRTWLAAPSQGEAR